MIGLIINRRLSAALFNPAPETVQTAIKTMLLSLPMIDAGLILFATGKPAHAAATAALVIPAILLSRWIRIT